MVKKTPMQAFRLEVYCEECKCESSLKFLSEGKIKKGFIHKCPGCGHEEYLDRQFPCLTFEVTPNIVVEGEADTRDSGRD